MRTIFRVSPLRIHHYTFIMKLTLVGAGPGDPELITLKAVRALETADVVMYDALVSRELLNYCRPDALQVYVGKRKGAYSCTQEEINPLIVHYAQTYGHVVRLKGGDPFVFGRGYEEAEFARQHGIEVVLVPGISSTYAVPALAGIPLTSRGIAESFWVVTGTTKNGELSNDLQLAAQSSATVVVLMGIHQLAKIVALFSTFGKANLPVAIIQNGSTPDERMVVGRVSDIAERAEKEGISNPSVIILGEVVGLLTNPQLITKLNRFQTSF